MLKKTTTKTITTIQIDTIIKYVPDTSLKRNAKDADSIIYLHDTVTVKNEVATAKSFFNPLTRKIEITLKGNVIDIPIKIHARQVEKVKVIEHSKFPFWFWMILGFVIGIILYVILKR